MAGYYIYRITNNINGKTYIGQKKFTSLLKDDDYMGSGIALRSAIKKYGIENFSKTILAIAPDKFEINVLEKYYITNERKSNKNGCYNIASGGDGGDTGTHHHSNKGQHWYTNGIIDVMSEECPIGFYKGRSTLPPCTDAHRKATSMALKGKHHSLEHNKKVSEAHKGKAKSEETKRKISETLKSKSSEIFTNEYRKNHSEIMKKWWEERKWALK